MTKTICDICGKEIPTTTMSKDPIYDLNFAFLVMVRCGIYARNVEKTLIDGWLYESQKQ